MSSSGSFRDVDTRSRARSLLDHVEVAQAEEVHLQQAERLDVAHRELRHELLVCALLLQRHDVDQRLGADHDTGGVDRVRPRQAFERLCEVDDLARDRIEVDARGAVGTGLQAILERLPRSFGDHLGDLVADAVGLFEHAACIVETARAPSSRR